METDLVRCTSEAIVFKRGHFAKQKSIGNACGSFQARTKQKDNGFEEAQKSPESRPTCKLFEIRPGF
jgi:hypothetical protein